MYAKAFVQKIQKSQGCSKAQVRIFTYVGDFPNKLNFAQLKFLRILRITNSYKKFDHQDAAYKFQAKIYMYARCDYYFCLRVIKRRLSVV